MKNPDLAYITPAYDDRPAEIVIQCDGEIISHPMTLNTMTKLLIQLAAEIKNVATVRT